MSDTDMKDNIDQAVAAQAANDTGLVIGSAIGVQSASADVNQGAGLPVPPQVHEGVVHHALHAILDKVVDEFKLAARFTEEEVAHIIAVFKKHI